MSTVSAAHDPADPDAPVGAALGEAAGEDDRLRDGRARVEHVRSGILHEARDVEPLRDRHVDDVAVLQRDVTPRSPELQLAAVDRDRLGRLLARLRRVDDDHLVAGVDGRRSGQRQRLEQRDRGAGQRQFPGRADFAGDDHAAGLELIHLDADLRVPDVARLQQRGDLDLRLRQRQAGEHDAAEIGHRDGAVGVDAVLAGQLRLVADDDRQVVLRTDDVSLGQHRRRRRAQRALGLRDLEVRLERRRDGRRLSPAAAALAPAASAATARAAAPARARAEA